METKTKLVVRPGRVPATTSLINYSQSDLGDNPSVNLATGRLRYTFGDLNVGSGNYAINVHHVYISNLHTAFKNKFNMFGNRWKLNLSQCVIKESDKYVYLDELGEIHRFVNFDDNRFYDDRNAKTTLTVNTDGYVISDGVGNKLYFNTNGLLIKSVACHHSSMVKSYNYDDKGRLVSVYDNRTIPDGGSVPKSRIELEYDETRLISMTSYGNCKKLLQINYTYNTDGNLTAVTKITFDNSNTQEESSKQTLFLSYDSELLTFVLDCESNSAVKIEYSDDKIIKQTIGPYVEPKKRVLQNNEDSSTVIIAKAIIRKGFKELKHNEYNYNVLDSLSFQTDVTNENGITLAYFIDQTRA